MELLRLLVPANVEVKIYHADWSRRAQLLAPDASAQLKPSE
jgi:hypothetical protein